MVLGIIACVVVVWLALSVLVALLFGRAVKMADAKHRDAMIFRELTKPARRPAREMAHSR